MKHEQLSRLGQALKQEFQSLLIEYVTGWLDETYLTWEDLQELQAIELGLYSFFGVSEEFLALEQWLTSGFIPGDLCVEEGGVGSGEWGVGEADIKPASFSNVLGSDTELSSESIPEEISESPQMFSPNYNVLNKDKGSGEEGEVRSKSVDDIQTNYLHSHVPVSPRQPQPINDNYIQERETFTSGLLGSSGFKEEAEIGENGFAIAPTKYQDFNREIETKPTQRQPTSTGLNLLDFSLVGVSKLGFYNPEFEPSGLVTPEINTSAFEEGKLETQNSELRTQNLELRTSFVQPTSELEIKNFPTKSEKRENSLITKNPFIYDWISRESSNRDRNLVFDKVVQQQKSGRSTYNSTAKILLSNESTNQLPTQPIRQKQFTKSSNYYPSVNDSESFTYPEEPTYPSLSSPNENTELMDEFETSNKLPLTTDKRLFSHYPSPITASPFSGQGVRVLPSQIISPVYALSNELISTSKHHYQPNNPSLSNNLQERRDIQQEFSDQTETDLRSHLQSNPPVKGLQEFAQFLKSQSLEGKILSKTDNPELLLKTNLENLSSSHPTPHTPHPISKTQELASFLESESSKEMALMPKETIPYQLVQTNKKINRVEDKDNFQTNSQDSLCQPLKTTPVNRLSLVDPSLKVSNKSERLSELGLFSLPLTPATDTEMFLISEDSNSSNLLRNMGIERNEIENNMEFSSNVQPSSPNPNSLLATRQLETEQELLQTQSESLSKQSDSQDSSTILNSNRLQNLYSDRFKEREQEIKTAELPVQQKPSSVIHSIDNSELDMDLILEAIAREINREYKRFYGD